MTYSGAKVSKEESCDETKEESVSDSVSENRVGNVDDEYEDLSYIESSTSSQANLIYNHKEQESEAIIQSNNSFKLQDFKPETEEINETEETEESEEGNEIGEIEEPAGKSTFQIESAYEEKATNLVGVLEINANKNKNIADET